MPTSRRDLLLAREMAAFIRLLVLTFDQDPPVYVTTQMDHLINIDARTLLARIDGDTL